VDNSRKKGIIGLGIPLDNIFSMIIVNMIISYHIFKTRCKVLFEEGFLVNVVETISDIISMFLL
jgi:ABC-type Co2+ transport system permease subunit